MPKKLQVVFKSHPKCYTKSLCWIKKDVRVMDEKLAFLKCTTPLPGHMGVKQHSHCFLSLQRPTDARRAGAKLEDAIGVATVPEEQVRWWKSTTPSS
ncbi:hypothetical protein XELAEV_18044279mg [Xenopus laevis]|uniref:Uncharacterized protein n=1 Tax=Xenopus laevis TaxID=8355 RepID=A0A974H3L2_XENLA|nr:hypothetical protein XELAEV_18044279mg [Xenopus laevis]